MGYTIITIKLSDYLAMWLNAVTKDMGRTPDDFIAEILHRYYDIWMLGRESCKSN